MMTPTRRTVAIVGAVAILAAVAGVLIQPAVAEKRACPRPEAQMRFRPQTYVDIHRAGGEPTVETHRNGMLLYGAHAGTTHVYAPEAADPTSAAFAQKYTGQAYYYYSRDDGRTWTFVDRTLPPKNLAGSGFSDPDFALDKAGHVYISEINLVNVAVSKSTTRGRSYDLQNFFGQTMTDRQWMEGDRKNELYLVGNAFAGGTFPTQPVGNLGHHVYKSTNGGVTFSEGVSHPDGLGDIQVDKRNGTLYEADYDDDKLGMAIFRNARSGDLSYKVHPIAEGVDMLSHWPSFDIDRDGNLYIVWDESGEGGRPAGVWLSYSDSAGREWSRPIRVDGNHHTDIWPWLAVGDPVGSPWRGWRRTEGFPNTMPRRPAITAGGSKRRPRIPVSGADDPTVPASDGRRLRINRSIAARSARAEPPVRRRVSTGVSAITSRSRSTARV